MRAASESIPEPLRERLRVLDTLSRGTGGAVLRCHDRELDRVVICKLADELWSDEAAARLGREARLLAAVSHPGVLKVLGSGIHDGTRWMLVEHLLGADLDDYVRARGPLPLDEALALTQALAGALAAVHAQQVFHRDLKPANIVVVPDRGPVIIDFGLALHDDLTTITGVDDRMGTPAFMAPEQVLGEPATAQADLYAVGLILHFMLLGRNTMSRGSIADAMRAQIEDAPEAIPGLPAPVAALIDRLTAKVAADRPESGDELAEDIAALRAGRPAPLRTPRTAARVAYARMIAAPAPRAARGPLPVAATAVMCALLALALMPGGAPVEGPRAVALAGRPGPGAERLWCALPAGETPWQLEPRAPELAVEAEANGLWITGAGACLGDVTLAGGGVRARVSGALAQLDEIRGRLREDGAAVALAALLPVVEEALVDPAVPAARRWALYAALDELPDSARPAALLARFVPVGAAPLAGEVVPPENALLADARGAPLEPDGSPHARRVTVIGGPRAAREPLWIALEVSGLAPGAAVCVRLDARRRVHLRGAGDALLMRARLPAGALRPGDNTLALGYTGGAAPRLRRAWAWAGEAR